MLPICRFVNASAFVEKSSFVFASFNVTEQSMNVTNSTRVKKSVNVTQSGNVRRSKRITKSFNIFKSKDVGWGHSACVATLHYSGGGNGGSKLRLLVTTHRCYLK